MVQLARTADVDLTPSRTHSAEVTVDVADSMPPSATAISVPVRVDGEVPALLGLDRATLAAAGFTGEAGQSLLIPRSSGPSLVAVGIGDPAGIDAAKLRDAAAAFARGAGKHSQLAMSLENVPNVPLDVEAQAVVEGVLLSRYHYDAFRGHASGTPVARLTLVGRPEQHADLARGPARGTITAAAAQPARALANAPATHLTATRMGEVAEVIAAERGLGVEVFDRDQLVAMGCGGLLGVNAGSAEPPRLIKLTYRPRDASGGAAQ